jgi:phosphoserine phosphatase
MCHDAPITPESWARLCIVLERLAASSNLDEVLGLIIDSIRDCLGAERASVFQFDKAAQELFISSAHGVAAIRIPITKGIAGEAARTGSIINVPDCYADPRFNPEIDKKTGFRTRNMLTIPLMSFDGGLEGVAQVLNKDPARGNVFDHADETLARALASQAAVAIRRAKLIEAEQRKKKIEADLATARKIQQASFPKVIPEIPGYQIAAASIPAEETGGDAFDLVDLGSHNPAGPHPGMVFILGDATGHGIGPALSAAQFRAMVRMGCRLATNVHSMSELVNIQLCEDLPPGRFVTALIGHLDPQRHHVDYCSCGQAPLLVIRADGTCEFREANAMPMGVDPSLNAETAAPWTLAPGDIFALISDGYYEAMNPQDQQMGPELVARHIAEARDKTPQQIIDHLNAAANAYAKGRPFDDDRTAIVIKRST